MQTHLPASLLFATHTKTTGVGINSSQNGTTMTPESSSVVTISSLLHCQFRFPSRRFCRLPIADNDSGFCFKHANQQRKERDLAELASALTGKSEGFQTAAGINPSLGPFSKLLPANNTSPPPP